MWLLRQVEGGKIYYLKPCKVTKFGRKQGDITLPGDQSISRQHAEINVILKEELQLSDRVSVCKVKDTNSKYGTYIIRNEKEFKVADGGSELEPGDILKIGVSDSLFEVEYIPIITATSRISGPSLNKINEIMEAIGGLRVDAFEKGCTHLTVKEAATTDKVISAVTEGVPIVDMKYWKSVMQAIDSNQELPNPNNFELPLKDLRNSPGVSLKPDRARKTLFEGKIFVFFAEPQYREKKKMIKDAGGKSLCISEKSTRPIEEFLDEKVIVIQPAIKNATVVYSVVFYEELLELMKLNGIRPIAEYEIPLSILHTSMERYCNPKYNYEKLMKRKEAELNEFSILVPDTEDLLAVSSKPTTASKITKRTCIPETVPESEDLMAAPKPSVITKPSPKPKDKVIIKETEEELSADTESVREIQQEKPKTSRVSNRWIMDEDFSEKSTKKIEPRKPTPKIHDKKSRPMIQIDDLEENLPPPRKIPKNHESKKLRHTNQEEDLDDCLAPSKSIPKNGESIRTDKKLQEFGFQTQKVIPVVDLDDLDDLDDVRPIKSEIKNEVLIENSDDLDLPMDVEHPVREEKKKSKKKTEKVRSKVFDSDSEDDEKNVDRIDGHKQPSKSKSVAENMRRKDEIKKPKKKPKKENTIQRPLIRTIIPVKSEIDTYYPNAKNNFKAFKKIDYIVPFKRIALSDMRVWTPNP